MNVKSFSIHFVLGLVITFVLPVCQPKIANEATAHAYEQNMYSIVKPFMDETAKLYLDTKRVYGQTQKYGERMSGVDSSTLFNQYHKCDSMAKATLAELSSLEIPEEISNYDNGELNKLLIHYIQKNRKDLNGPFYNLLKLFCSQRTAKYDSLEFTYVAEHEKRQKAIDSIKQTISKLPYYQSKQ